MLRTFSRRVTAVVLGLLVALSGAWTLVSGPAHAADVTYPDAISNIRLTNTSSTDGTNKLWNRFRIDADWQVPNDAKAGETFGMTLPDEFGRLSSGFDVKNDNGDLLATCTVSSEDKPELVCTLTDFVETHEEVSGSLWLQVEATEATENTYVEFIINGEPFEVDLPGDGGIIGDNPATKVPWKNVIFVNDKNEMTWNIQIPSDVAENGTMRITDDLVEGTDANGFESHSLVGLDEGGYLSINRRLVDADGQFTGKWEAVPEEDYTASFPHEPGGKSFEVEFRNIPDSPKYIYGLNYKTKPDDGVLVEGNKFSNDATVQTEKLTRVYEYRARGGGDGDGVQYTRFSVQKSVAGEAAAAVPEDTTFTVEYTAVGETKTLEVGIGEDGTARSGRYPLGTEFTIREVNLPDIEGVEWGEYVITGEGVTRNADGSYSLTPDSTATVELALENVANPTTPPTEEPTTPPTEEPTTPPTEEPTTPPTEEPTTPPTDEPTDKPSDRPSDKPSDRPSDQPRNDRDDNRHLPRTGTTLLPIALGAVLLGLGATAVGVSRRSRN